MRDRIVGEVFGAMYRNKNTPPHPLTTVGLTINRVHQDINRCTTQSLTVCPPEASYLSRVRGACTVRRHGLRGTVRGLHLRIFGEQSRGWYGILLVASWVLVGESDGECWGHLMDVGENTLAPPSRRMVQRT